mmetsp:Transcript_19637/g.28385  ORF Transcript_19637/g.28385 Transcript_19637/m.28385 type:complete len:129 (-) Transcript_19637:1456-1842(-)
MTSTRELRISQNIFLGTLPSEIGLLDQLTRLEIMYDRLGGELPSELNLLTNLSKLEHCSVSSFRRHLVLRVDFDIAGSFYLFGNSFTKGNLSELCENVGGEADFQVDRNRGDTRKELITCTCCSWDAA